MSRKASFGSALLRMEPEGSVLWPIAMCIAGTALLRQVAPEGADPKLVATLAMAVLGFIVAPTKQLGLSPLKRRLLGAVYLGTLGFAYATLRTLSEWVDLIAISLVLVFALATCAPRLLRLFGIEWLKLRKGRLFKVGLVAAALVTLLSGLTLEPLEGSTGWTISAHTMGTGLWVAEVFLLVLGATTLAGELGQGTMKMILPHAYRRSEWIAAKALVLGFAGVLFAAVVLVVSLGHAHFTAGLGDIVKELPPGFGEEEGSQEIFLTAGVMGSHLMDAVVIGLASLIASALLGLLFSSMFDSVVPALSSTFLLFLGLKSADVLLGLSRDVLLKIYAWYPERLRELTGKLGRGLNENWDATMPDRGLLLAVTAGAVAWLLSVALFSRRDLHG